MPTEDHDTPSPKSLPKAKLGVAAAAMLAVGGLAGAALVAQSRPSATMAPTAPVAIRSLSSSGIVTITGKVAQIYGNKFILADASGSALVETGREGEDGKLVTPGEPVLVQGRFEHGFVHAAFLVGPDKKVVALGPLGGPHHGRGGPGGPHHREDGPDAPPPPAAGNAPPAGDTAAPAPAPAPAT